MATEIGERSDAHVGGGARAPRWLRGIFIANLVAQIGIVVTGGIVRLTGSGLGCPTWPECAEGSYIPTSRQEESWHKYIEFGNRLLTFVLAALAIAAIVGAYAWWRRSSRAGAERRGAVLALAAIPLIGTIVQALLGGVTVVTGLNPWAVSAHFLVSMVIIAGCVVLVVRAGEVGDRPVTALVRPEIRLLARALVAVTAVVVVLGVIVTGSGPHSGDADTEARFGVDPRTVSWLHADSVLLFLGLTVGLLVALRVTHAPPRALRLTALLLVVSLIQGLVGYAQYFSGLPWALVAFHMLGACLVWALAIFVLLSMRSRGIVRALEGARD
ncbi:MAG: COX15/CtaA family protein [Candidatus Nanopelagicales bacterium]|jgi:cytochrome c oxidase assembly protein subunit 15